MANSETAKNDIYPCVVCNEHCANSALLCGGADCKGWVHYLCSQQSIDQILIFDSRLTRKYSCPACTKILVKDYKNQFEYVQTALANQEQQLELKRSGITNNGMNEDRDSNLDENDFIKSNLENKGARPKNSDSIIRNENSERPLESRGNRNTENNDTRENRNIESSETRENRTSRPMNTRKDAIRPNSNDICKFYKESWCKKKNSCPYLHPTICKDFMWDGFGAEGCQNYSCEISSSEYMQELVAKS